VNARALVLARLVWLEMLRRKDLYTFAVLVAALLLALTSMDVFGLGGANRYVLDLGLLLVWLFSYVLAVRTACRQLPAEERSGSILPLLAKPVSRWDVLVGKWLGAGSVAVAAAALMTAFVAGVVALRGEPLDGAALSQAWLLHSAGLLAAAALGLALSTRCNADAAEILTFVALAASWLIVPGVPRLLVGETGIRAAALSVLYYLFPHFELFDLRMRAVHGWGPAPAGPALLILLYAGALTALFLGIAWLSYRTKRWKREDQIS
jgi:ABC-type transport system involved in multi-copper enzyme maturation permease subunit